MLISVNYFDQVGHEILQNRYLKTNFGDTEIRGSHFFKFHKGNFLRDNLFLELKMHMLRTINARNI